MKITLYSHIRSIINSLTQMLSVLVLSASCMASAQNKPPVQIFYLPFPENQALTALSSIAANQNSYKPANPMYSYTSIALFATNTVIYYDHWENGFDSDIANPRNIYSASNPGGTQIWGDADPSNGYPPGYPNDILNAGDIIILNESFNTTSRGSTIYYDGGDKIASTKPVAVTRAVWASGSSTHMAMANEVYDTAHFGTEFHSPVGQDITAHGNLFQYSGFMIMAGQEGATVQIDKDNNGSFEETITLGQGESYLVDGGVLTGGHIVSDKPIQVELITGNKSSFYESRSFHLFPQEGWSSSYTTPVATRTANATTIWLYNDADTLLTVEKISRSGNNLVTNTITVAANSYARDLLADGSGARFVAPGGERFYAIAAIDSNSASGSNQSYDWGFTLVPDKALTQQALVGLGLGRDPTATSNENGSPIWVTPIGNGNNQTVIYVDYDGDPATGNLTDPWGNKYDIAYTARELEIIKVYNPSGDQSGMLVYTLEDDVVLAAAWGGEPGVASDSTPGLDLGTGIPPFPLYNIFKHTQLVEDADEDGFISPGDLIEYVIWVENTGRQPVTDLSVSDTLPESLHYYVESTEFTDHTNHVHIIGDDLLGDTIFPLDESGYYFPLAALPVRNHWAVTYRTRIPTFDDLQEGEMSLVNFAAVNGVGSSVTNSVVTPLIGRVGDFVWYDANHNGLQDEGEPGVSGVTVRLLDATGNPVRNSLDEYIVAETDAQGYYELRGVPAGEYQVEFTLPGGYDFTTQNADNEGVNGSVNSTPNATTGVTDLFTLRGGEFKRTLDAGLKRTGSIGDRIWIDGNNDGLQDEGEPGLNGVIVRLLNASGNTVATTISADHPETGEAGYYFFEGLAPGSYRVEFVLTGEDSFTTQNADGAGLAGERNSDVNPANGRTELIALGANQWLAHVDAGVLSKIQTAKSSSAGATLAPGDIITYTVSVTNSGATAQTGVKIRDVIPAGTTLVPGSVAASLSVAPLVMTSTTFNNSSTFTVPDGVTSLTVETWGGGGRGSTRTSNGVGGGGGGGGYSSKTFSVTPGATYTVNVGAGSSSTTAGGDSWFSLGSANNAEVLAKGGSSVANNTTTGGAGGAANSGVGTILRSGGHGANGSGSNGGGGGSSAGYEADGTNGSGSSGGVAPEGGGNGGAGRSGTQGSGTDGTVPGGGGGGAYRTSWSDRIGGSGADGRVVVSYAVPETMSYNSGSANFVVPPGVTEITVESWGGGGGGGSTAGNQAGGGGGAYARSVLQVTPGESYTVVVGTGGGPGLSGGDSIFGGGLVKAEGGANSVGATAGAGGRDTSAYSTGDFVRAGGTGGGSGGSYTGGGGGGSGGPDGAGESGGPGVNARSGAGGTGGAGYGAGGAGGARNSNGVSGSAPGGGGGGKGSGSTTSGSGANGRINVHYMKMLFGDLGEAPDLASDWTIPAGEILTLIYQVEVDGPQVSVTNVINRAEITTDGYSEPFTPSTESPIDPVYLSGIGDRVWLDSNGNGIQDSGEPGITNVTVTLYQVSGSATNAVATQVTDASGNYSFTGLIPGSYLVQVTPPAGASVTIQFEGEDESVDSDGNLLGWSELVELAGGEYNSTVDFGFVTATAAISGTFWLDRNGDGLQDEGEPGVANMVAQLRYGDGTPVRDPFYGSAVLATSDANGNYTFENLYPGEYIVTFAQPMEYFFTLYDADGVGLNSTQNSLADPVTGWSPAFTLTAGQHRTHIDAGFVTGAEVGDRVWVDTNNNGLQDAGEPGYNGITVRLLDSQGAAVRDRLGRPLVQESRNHPETGEAGYYFFGGLQAGEYQIAVDSPEGDNMFTIWNADAEGVAGEKNSDINPATGRSELFVLAAGETILSVDIGILSKLEIGKQADTAGPIKPGDVITYTVVVTNGGATAQTNLSIFDQMPVGTTFVPGSFRAYMPGVTSETTSQTYDSGSTTFMVPPGVSEITVEAWGGGGRGSTRNSGNGYGGGGGGGAYARRTFSVVPGQSYTASVGAGSSSTSAGEDSLFYLSSSSNPEVRAKGGSSAGNNSDSGAAGGVAAQSIGDVVFSGGRGADATSNRTGGGGSSAGYAADGTNGSGQNGGIAPEGGGNGAEGRSTAGAGTVGNAPGGGGSGARRSGNTSYNGGSGGSGKIIVTHAKLEQQTFASSGTFEVPLGVNQTLVEAWGGGGAGRLGNGGGGGAYSSSILSVTSGQSFDVTVGEGGIANDNSSAPVANGSSSVFGESLIVAAGGSGAAQGAGNPGAGGTRPNSVGDIRYAGGNGGTMVGGTGGGGGGGSAFTYADGGNGSNNAPSGTSGGAGGSGTGAGGSGGNRYAGGQSGSMPGGGGGGRGDGATNPSGNGAPGMITVTWLATEVDTTGAPPELVSDWELPAGKAIVVTYQVEVDGPDVAAADIINHVQVVSDDYPDPLEDSVVIPVGAAWLGALGYRVWLDQNGNGIQDQDEPGIEGTTVELYQLVEQADGSVATNYLGSTLTDAEGLYSFERLPPGSYTTRVNYPEGMRSSPIGEGEDDLIDSDGNSQGWAKPAYVSAGKVNNELSFGLYEPARLYGYAFWDKDKNNVRNDGDGANEGMEIHAYRNGAKVGTTWADADGFYEFTELQPGDYEIRFIASLEHLVDLPPKGSHGSGNKHRNRATANHEEGYAVITHSLLSGVGYDGAEPLNAGFTGNSPLSSGIDLRAYAAADGVYVEFIAYDVESDDWMTLYLLDSNGNVLWFGSVAVVAGDEQFVRFKVPGLTVDQSYDFAIRDEVGKIWWADDIKIGSLKTKMIAMSNQGVILTFNSLPERNYAIEWTAELGKPWQLVRSVTAINDQTTVVVQPLDTGSPAGFFRVVLQ